MINTIVAYDDNDADLGDYFTSSHDSLVLKLAEIAIVSNLSIRGLDCTEVFLNQAITPFNGGRFVFIGISHGNEEELVSHEVYVSTNNLKSFCNSLFYSCACSTAYKLGNDLITAGCLAFVGYSDTVYINTYYSETFHECQNYCIKEFLSSEESIETSFDKMTTYYNKEIDRLVAGSMDDLIAASSLISNRNCLKLLGDKKLTSKDIAA